jgi:hypothetical protein
MRKLVVLPLLVMLSGCAPLPAAQPVADVDLSVTEKAEVVAELWSVTIDWSDDPASECGASEDAALGACYLPPARIVIQSGLDWDLTKYLVLHQLGHVEQYRIGVPLDECGGDLFAHMHSSTISNYTCEIGEPAFVEG